jgi:hypothetical protein
MGTVKLNVRGVAKYIAAGPAKQRRVLRDYKYPDPQGYAQAGYYRDAQEIIEAYHRGEYENEWLLQRAAELQVQAAAMVGQRSTRLRSNATALRSYATHFGERRLEVLAHLSLRTTIAGSSFRPNQTCTSVRETTNASSSLSSRKISRPRN